MDIPAVTPYKIRGRLGGNNNPIEPDAVIKPKENFLLYPSLINIGKSNPPKANIVTPDPPVRAVKKPHINNTITGVPPGNHPKTLLNTKTRRSDALLYARKYPAKVNKGIVARCGETTIL